VPRKNAAEPSVVLMPALLSHPRGGTAPVAVRARGLQDE
jgi:hypothetical protein